MILILPQIEKFIESIFPTQNAEEAQRRMKGELTAEEAKKQAEEEAKRKAEEEAKKQADAEAQQKQEFAQQCLANPSYSTECPNYPGTSSGGDGNTGDTTTTPEASRSPSPTRSSRNPSSSKSRSTAPSDGSNGSL